MTDPTRGVDRHEAVTPDPDDPRKPDSPGDLSKRSWFYVARKTVREFVDDECTDLAAALTYYAVLSIFPAAIALTSLLGVFGRSDDSVDLVLDVLRPLVAPETLGTVEPALRQVAGAPGAGLALVVGLAVAVWTASNYINAFSRAMNRIYEIAEGRPFWKLRPAMVLVTLASLVLMALVLLLLLVSGPLAESIGEVLGLGSTALLVWKIAKWPVVAVAVMVIVAILYWATPNVKQPRFRWLSVGAAVAIVVWIVAGAAFTVYVSYFGSYNKTYGSLAGVIIALVFLWISNLALLFGAEIDAELERGRQLQAGIPAERDLQLPARDTRQIRKAEEKERKDVELGRRIRAEHGPGDRSPDHPTTHEEER